jgi:hypothetical protein
LTAVNDRKIWQYKMEYFEIGQILYFLLNLLTNGKNPIISTT